MLGDSSRLLRDVLRKSNLRLAFRYAYRDRLREWFYDPFELEWAARK